MNRNFILALQIQVQNNVPQGSVFPDNQSLLHQIGFSTKSFVFIDVHLLARRRLAVVNESTA